MRALPLIPLVLIAVLTSGCAALLAPALLLDAASTGVNVYQSREARHATEALTEEVRPLREALERRG